ncbi:DUF1763-domain-containing protein [Patellaria atrata CBS 101060]|uniref:DUF1763-domain-containing protein n=1 Tax=Patellaria atrata CBS 101060 TaxID=1346257 RepID=A0A9P4VMM5_9PEZI|nr:DUF1763-domain-containing protein [Patellaria atrata CBS 101060]
MSLHQAEVIHAYRHLYRHALRAVRFAVPARYIIRDRIRHHFRDGDLSQFDQGKIDRTIEFLQYASRERGLEHKILKNFMNVLWHRHRRRPSKPADLAEHQFKIDRTAYDHFDHTLRMLNESMGMCLY